jgi:CBS domain-containing protein
MAAFKAQVIQREPKMNTIQVGEVFRLHGNASISVSEDASVEYVLAYLGHEQHIRGVFLVDADQKFKGIITSSDIRRWVHIELFGGKGRHEIPISTFYRIADAKKARDLARGDYRSLGVRETDSLQTALDKMLDFEEDIIPVFDSEGYVLGDLRLSEVLFKALEVGKQRREAP